MTVPPVGPPDGPSNIDMDFEEVATAATTKPPPRRSLRANTLIVMAGTLGSRLSGILRQMLMNTMFSNTLLDAMFTAVRVPNLMRELLAEGALVNSFIPVYKTLDTQGRKELASAFSGVLIAVNLLLMALGILGAPLLIDLLIAENSNVDRSLAIYMAQLVMPFLMLISLSSIAMGLLNADEHFKESSFAPVAFNIASIVVLLLLPHTATWLGFGWLIGGLAQLLVQLPALRRFELLPTPRLASHPALRRVLVQMAPFTLTAGARQFLNFYVQGWLSNAAFFSSGTVAGYANAETLFNTVNGLFIVSPVLAMFPRFAEYAAQKNWQEFRALTAQALRSSTFLAAPMSALLVALAPYAVSVVNLSKHFDPERFHAGSEILRGWSLALVPWAFVTLLLRTFYARERTREAVTISAVGFVLEVLLYRLLVPRVGLVGFGLSTMLSGLLMTAALVTLYRRSLGFPARELLLHLAKVLPLAVLAGVVAWLIAKVMPTPGYILPGMLGLAVAGGAGLGVYLVGALALRMPELAGVLRRIKR